MIVSKFDVARFDTPARCDMFARNHNVRHTAGYGITALWLGLILLPTVDLWSQEAMTPKRFRELAASPGDSDKLCPELAMLPLWRDAKCSITMRFEDGRAFKEDCAQTVKTVNGKYIVFSMESEFYKQTMYSIVGYDDKAQAVREWGLFGDTLTEGTMVVDSEKRVIAATSAYGDGFMEISAGCWSDSEESHHTLVYKGGVLFMTRDVKIRPVAATTAR